MKTDKQIKEIFGITDEQMRILFFEIGFAFAKHHFPVTGIANKKRFWTVFGELWELDDRCIINHPKVYTVDYPSLKKAIETDIHFLVTFREQYCSKSEPDADVWRKRCMASIGGYLRLAGKASNAQIIQAIACRATGVEDFNKIPISRLRNLYNAFLKQQKDFKAIKETIKI